MQLLVHLSKWSILTISLATFFSYRLDAHASHEEEETVEFQWTKEKSVLADIQLKIAGPGQIQNFIEVSGKITTHPDYVAYVIPKVSGVVWEIRKNLGDPIEKGEVLALIESKEIAEAKVKYLTALKHLKVQQTLLDKEKVLKGISTEQEFLKAELAKDEAALQVEGAAQHLYTLGFTEEEITEIDQESPGKRRFYEMKAPSKGKVVQRNLTVGEQVDSSAKVFTLANFEKVWVEINVAQNDVHNITEGFLIEILGEKGKQANLYISQFNPTISEETRTATLLAVLENPSDAWVPGEFISARIQTSTTPAQIVVSKEALQNIKGDYYVFIEEAGALTPCAVKLGKMDAHNVEILSGVKCGDSYAACNTFYLKAEYEKGEAEHEH